MNVGDLLSQFRSSMFDQAEPYFWTDEEIRGYIGDAYKMFVRLTGGIADFTSSLTQVPIVAGQNIGAMSKKILRVMEAYRLSDGAKIEVINQTDLTFKRDNDYGQIRPIYLDTTPGPVRYMIIGFERGKCKWVQLPEVNDMASLFIYRLPKDDIALDNSTDDFEFDEIGEEHVTHLNLWMRHLALLKADADTFDKGKSDDFKNQFTEYCSLAKAEVERAKHKTRVVSYGGL